MTRARQRYQKITKFLAKNPGESFYLRELAQKLKQDPGNLSRDLKILVAQGKLAVRRRGSQTYYRLAIPVEKQPLLNLEEVRRLAKNYEKEIAKLTQDLIRIPSICDENDEEEIAEFLAKKVRALGFSPQIVAKEKHRPNLIVNFDPSKKDHFLLLGHMDTVGIGDIEDWRYYPFSGHISGGRIYGRGAADMKAGIACELYTLKILKELRLNLPLNVRLILVVNEEAGVTPTPVFDLGMVHLLEKGYVKGRTAIYGYGGTYNLGIGHRGVLRLKITTHGESVHGGSIKWEKGDRGVNAVTGMAEILLALEKFRLPKTHHPSFPKHGNVLMPGGVILHGGTAVSVVPNLCESTVEVRYLPGLDIKKVHRQIKALVEKAAQKRPGLEVNVEKFMEIPPISLSPEERIIKILKKVCQEIYHQPITARGTGPANESFMLIKKGIPTVVFGPTGGRAHSDDEFVYINSFARTIEVYIRAIHRFCYEEEVD